MITTAQTDNSYRECNGDCGSQYPDWYLCTEHGLCGICHEKVDALLRKANLIFPAPTRSIEIRQPFGASAGCLELDSLGIAVRLGAEIGAVGLPLWEYWTIKEY